MYHHILAFSLIFVKQKQLVGPIHSGAFCCIRSVVSYTVKYKSETFSIFTFPPVSSTRE